MKFTYILDGSITVDAENRRDADATVDRLLECLDWPKNPVPRTVEDLKKLDGRISIVTSSVQWDENGETQEEEL